MTQARLLACRTTPFAMDTVDTLKQIASAALFTDAKSGAVDEQRLDEFVTAVVQEFGQEGVAYYCRQLRAIRNIVAKTKFT